MINITNVTTYLFFALIFIAFNFLILSFLYNGFKDIKKSLKNNWKLFALTGILTFGYRITQMYTLSLASVSIVLSIKILSVFIGVLLGGELFHEKNLKRKIFASTIMVVGVFLILM